MLEVNNLSAMIDDQQLLSQVSYQFQPGRVYGLIGRSGSGKTSFLRSLNGLLLADGGQVTGEILVNNERINDWSLLERGELFGSVFQDPRTQFFTTKVWTELAFGCENYCLPSDEIHERLQALGKQFQLTPLFDQSLAKLSSGQQQLIACSSVMALEPSIYLLDEPTANLDQTGIRLLLTFLQQLKAQGHTLIIADHRLYWLLGLVDEFLYLDQGQLTATYTSAQLEQMSGQERRTLGLRAVSFNQINDQAPPSTMSGDRYQVGPIQLTYDDFDLEIDSLELSTQTVIAIVGDNGAGKTSLIEQLYHVGDKRRMPLTINGENQSRRTRRQMTRDSLIVMANATRQLFQSSVADEVAVYGQAPEDYLLPLGIGEELWDRHPQTLSGGQKQRVVVAGALASGKRFLYFDEPTSGLDYEAMQSVAQMIAPREGLTVVISHDVEFILACCHEVITVDQGRLCDHYRLDDAGRQRLLNYFS